MAAITCLLRRLPRSNCGARLALEEFMEAVEKEKVGRIRHLNDLLRCQGIGGQVMVTAGLDAFGEETVRGVIREIAAFTAFTEDNDPHGEHDCAILTVGDHRILWKIDYFDNDLRCHSPDASDPRVTKRVMTVMFADEY